MKITRGYQTELDLNNKQRTACLQHAGTARYAYNWALSKKQEDLHIAGMLKNHHVAQAVSDASMGEIKRQLTYKASWYGIKVVVIDRFYPSSKTCSMCGWINESLDLSQRVFVCVECGYVADRDYNAAKNILAVSLTDSLNACGAESSGYLVTGSETIRVEAGTKHHLGVS